MAAAGPAAWRWWWCACACAVWAGARAWTVNSDARYPYLEPALQPQQQQQQEQPRQQDQLLGQQQQQKQQQQQQRQQQEQQPPRFDDEGEVALYDGGRYLEGLRAALRAYLRAVDLCATRARAGAGAGAECEQWAMSAARAQTVAELSRYISKLAQLPTQDALEEHALVGRLAQLVTKLSSLTGYSPPADAFRRPPAAPASSTAASEAPDGEEPANMAGQGDTREQAAHLKELYADAGGQYADAAEQYAEAGEQYSDAGEQYADAGEEHNDAVAREQYADGGEQHVQYAHLLERAAHRGKRATKDGGGGRGGTGAGSGAGSTAVTPESPQQDISGYSKRKPGTSTRPDPAQAGMVRTSVARVSASPSPEVTRRFASNYNGQDIFMVAGAKTLADS